MPQFDILDPQWDPFRSLFLEASAGTGKTFTIEHLILRLLSESDPPIELSQILAVTFTKEAARDMKERVLAKLKIAVSQMEGEGKWRIQNALAKWTEMQIFTIHGFCHRMLKEHAFEAALPLGMGSKEQVHPSRALSLCIKDFLRTADCSFEADVGALFKRSRYDIEVFIRQVIEAMEEGREAKYPLFPEIPPISEGELEEQIKLFAPGYKRVKVESCLEQIAPFCQAVREKSFAPLLEEKGWFFEKIHRDNEKVSAKKAPRETAPFFQMLHDQLLPQLQVARDPDEIVYRIATACKERWEIKKGRENLFNYKDLLEKMEKALDRPPFLEAVASRYLAVIVDEFQDTDKVQWKIIERLFFKKHLLYLVGDPKQSIYGFRSADIYTYLQAANAFGKERKEILETNYRSSPRLVAALNALFIHKPHWLALPALRSSLSYVPVLSGRKEGTIDEEVITYFGVRGQMGRERSWPTLQMEEDCLFPYIAKEAIRLYETYKIPFSEMAILIKDRFQAQRLQRHLSRWNIPSTIKRTLHLADSRGFLAVEILLEALLYPDREEYGRLALEGALMRGGENRFWQLRRVFDEQGIVPLFRLLIEEDFCGHGERDLYLEVCQTIDMLTEEMGASLEDLLSRMREWKGCSIDEDERLELCLEQGDDCIRIMTTFGSKGLEFDVVFTPGLSSRHFSGKGDVELEAEKMRQLYVAFTRAREKLYIPFIIDLSQPEIPSDGKASANELFFAGIEVAVEWIDQITITPFCPQGQGKLLLPPPPLPSLTFPSIQTTSFSAMVGNTPHPKIQQAFDLQDLSKKTPHTLPLGSDTGILIHSLFETYFKNRGNSLEEMICTAVQSTHLKGYEESLFSLMWGTLHLPLIGDFSLSQLREGQYLQEVEFLFPREDTWVKGFIDLVFQMGNSFYLVDWKTNWLGPSAADYTEEALHLAIKEHQYDLQAKLYLEALSRYVKPFYNAPHIGGAYYLFVRGQRGIHIGVC